MELVVPGNGRRKTTTVGFTHNMPNRAFWYIDKEFSKEARDSMQLLAKTVLEGFPDPELEDVIVIIRPPREKTKGNQTPDEVAAIIATMDEVRVSGPTEFRFFRARKNSQSR